MKLHYFIAAILAAGMFTTSCSSTDEVIPEENTDAKTITAQVEFTATAPQSRVAISGNVNSENLFENPFFYWGSGDKIIIDSPEAENSPTGNLKLETEWEPNMSSAKFVSSNKSGVNIAIGEDLYLFVTENITKNIPRGGFMVDDENPYILHFRSSPSVEAKVGTDGLGVDFDNQSIFTEIATVPGSQVQASDGKIVALSGTLKVLTPVLCFKIPDGSKPETVSVTNFKKSAVYYLKATNGHEAGWDYGDDNSSTFNGDYELHYPDNSNGIVYIPVFPGSINDDATISCAGYTCSLKGLKDQLGSHNIIFIKNSHWVKVTTK